MTTTTHRPRTRAARQRLDLAIVELAAHNLRPPCGEASRIAWTSEQPNLRAQAAVRCRAECPLVELCAAAGDEAEADFGVWGGIDRGRKAA